MTDWSRYEKVCGNCQFWLLQGYQAYWEGAEPVGAGGYHTDGSASECRRHAPRDQSAAHELSGSARWPTTKRLDWCGDYVARDFNFIRPKEESGTDPTEGLTATELLERSDAKDTP